jgi:hypothetical protein
VYRRKLASAMSYWKAGGPRFFAGVVMDRLVCGLYPALPRASCQSLRMLLLLGYWPDIRNPRSLNEKIAHRMLFAPHPLESLVADKWRVRQYVTERGLKDILNDVYCVTDDPTTIPFDDLPDRFVIKANHGCDWNIIVRDKGALDKPAVIGQCREWLGLKYSTTDRSHETHYDSIPPLILVEKFLEEKGRFVPVDYKFYCFHGVPHYVEVHIGRFVRHTENFYDVKWREIIGRTRTPRGEGVPKPPRLAEMLDAAARLSSGFDFCRIDFYSPDSERIVFGEITMHPASGLDPVRREWDLRLGALW